MERKTIGSTRRLTALLLLAAMTAATAACSGGGSDAAATSAATSAPTQGETTSAVETVDEFDRSKVKDSLPVDLDFKGEKVRINALNDERYSIDWVAEQTGDIVQDAVYARNRSVEERLNVKLDIALEHEASASKSGPIINAILAGDENLQIVNIAAQAVTAFLKDNMLLNLVDQPYLDFDQPWWNSDIMTLCRIDNQAYFATGEIAFRYINGMAIFVFNTEVAENYGIKGLYDLFFDGGWTYDKLYEYTAMVSKDVDGNGVFDDKDVWGLDTNVGANIDPYYASWDQPLTKTGADGLPVLCANNAKMVQIVEKLYKLYYENKGCYSFNNSASGAIFSAGRALFTANQISYILTDVMRDAGFDFGILTFPKFDEAQDEYYTHNRSGYSLYSIAASAAKPKSAAAVLEAAAAESYRTVTMPYIETALKVKYSRDNDSARVIDVMLGGVKPDFAFYTDIMYILRNVIGGKSKDFASFYAANENTYQKILDDINANFK